MMQASSQRARVGSGSACDRLSALPDELLRCVLSFLLSQQAVQTTVLSKRWKDLWRSVPTINVDIFSFGTTSSDDWEEAPSEEMCEKMVDFTDSLLMIHNAPSLDEFQLDVVSASDIQDRHVHRWMRRAIKDDPLVLKARVVLHSGVYHFPHLGSSPRRLKRLHLFSVSLDHSFAERLRSGCPELEDLVLCECQLHFHRIQSDTLKNLVVEDCSKFTGDIFVIRASRLASFWLDISCYGYSSGVTLDAGNSLAKASVSLSSDELSPRNEAMLLGSLLNVTSLELYGFQAMAVLDKELGELPISGNLRTLCLEYCFHSRSDVQKVKALGRFLQKCPNLEKKLTFKNFWVEMWTS